MAIPFVALSIDHGRAWGSWWWDSSRRALLQGGAVPDVQLSDAETIQRVVSMSVMVEIQSLTVIGEDKGGVSVSVAPRLDGLMLSCDEAVLTLDVAAKTDGCARKMAAPLFVNLQEPIKGSAEP